MSSAKVIRGAIAALFSLLPLLSSRASEEGRTKSPTPLTVVAFGDSTTAPRDLGGGKVLVVYADLLREQLPAAGLPATVINAGVGGNSTTNARARFGTDVLAHNPDLAIIQFGLNDSCIDVWDGKDKPRVTKEDYIGNLTYFVETLRARNCTVILMTANPMRWTAPLLELYGKAPFDANDPWGFNLTNEAYVKAVRELSEAMEVPLVDVYQRFRDYDDQPDQATDDLLLDGMHPNEKGHAMIAGWLLDAIVSTTTKR